jgi:hypothetical protein
MLSPVEAFLDTNHRIVKQNELKKIYRAKHAKLAKNDSLSFRPKGEIFLRSLAFARDDGPRPVALAFFARDTNFSALLVIGKIQRCLARVFQQNFHSSLTLTTLPGPVL